MGHNRNDGHDPKLQVLIQPNIGLDSDVRLSVVEILNITLADKAVLTTKTRSAHWNVRGADFFAGLGSDGAGLSVMHPSNGPLHANKYEPRRIADALRSCSCRTLKLVTV